MKKMLTDRYGNELSTISAAARPAIAAGTQEPTSRTRLGSRSGMNTLRR